MIGAFVPLEGSRSALGYVVCENGCWEWVGGADRRGYGSLYRNGKCHPAHRYYYEMVKGPIPPGLQIDHLCRNPRCVRPDHLEAVTTRTNVLRGVGVTARNARKKTCPRGHPLQQDPFNPSWRRCPTCTTIRFRNAAKRRRQRGYVGSYAIMAERKPVRPGQVWKDTSTRASGRRFFKVLSVSRGRAYGYAFWEGGHVHKQRKTSVAVRRMIPANPGFLLIEEPHP